MTGYGKSESQLRGKKLICEIRSLNSKSMDISVRLASCLRAKELEIRNIVTRRLERGKVDLAICFQEDNAAAPAFTPINWSAVNYYAEQYKAHSLGILPPEVMAAILRFPDVLKTQDDNGDLSDEEWSSVQSALDEAIDAFIAFRTQEGMALQKMFAEKLDGIEGLLAQVEPFEKGRVAKIKERLEQSLAQLSKETQAQIDRNRLEQEMIYYLEKLDITEEKVRLTNHIKYFRETMDEPSEFSLQNSAGVGKKLGFIAQEMGREINTLGSKSNQSEMQIIVVKMKDILEQIKEQILNVL